MKKLDGISSLMKRSALLSGAGWIFVDSVPDSRSISGIVNAEYYIAEHDDEEIDMEETHHTFLEFGIFRGVVEPEANSGRHSAEDIAAGCLYYLENDTFRD